VGALQFVEKDGKPGAQLSYAFELN